jgi:hypothetical protein
MLRRHWELTLLTNDNLRLSSRIWASLTLHNHVIDISNQSTTSQTEWKGGTENSSSNTSYCSCWQDTDLFGETLFDKMSNRVRLRH